MLAKAIVVERFHSVAFRVNTLSAGVLITLVITRINYRVAGPLVKAKSFRICMLFTVKKHAKSFFKIRLSATE